MAEKKGFLRRIFSFGSAAEEERTPENGQTPRPNDLEIGREDAPDPDARPVAAASVVADAEAGAAASDNGGITPVSEMGRSGPDASGAGEAEETKKPEDAGAESPEAQKKNPMRSNWS
ncbi:hypothetical protein SAMN06297251_11845 [Fulvimarina manganoxydans]|uniref:Uncharacterized protein n=1 Tax=Fulvimarina manganoxydans TaxID=937218 RepID=A0A1W2DWP5_9HYPH|nr:hypothetical protein [Fulvimarina manganoxydans]SMD01486.1 hypothetical protein SAMN06297251_11845 [Fulvimarina manganoxydans]